MKEYEICEFFPTYNSDFQHSKLYPFQLASGLFLKLIFLKFRNFRFFTEYILMKKERNESRDTYLQKRTRRGALLGRKALNRIITVMMTLFLRGQV